MTRTLPQMSLRALLSIVTLFACITGMYVGLWEDHPVVPALLAPIIASALGTGLQWRRNRYGVSGAITGGVVGANLAVAAHFVCGYTMLESFEDEGLGLVGGVWLFAPYATLFGVIVGVVVWFVACAASTLRVGRKRRGTSG